MSPAGATHELAGISSASAACSALCQLHCALSNVCYASSANNSNISWVGRCNCRPGSSFWIFTRGEGCTEQPAAVHHVASLDLCVCAFPCAPHACVYSWHCICCCLSVLLCLTLDYRSCLLSFAFDVYGLDIWMEEVSLFIFAA